MPAEYFNNFPLTSYSLNPVDSPGAFEVCTDIFRRAGIIRNILGVREAFYEYVVLDGESPEIVANKFYGSPKYHWVVTIVNDIIDPLLEWPKKYGDLVAYVTEKYGSMAAASSQIHHYTMTETKVDSIGYSSSITTIIDKTKYDSLVSLVPVVYSFSDGRTITVTTTRSTVDAFTYENDLNEAKRKIRLLKDSYIPQVVSELETIMKVS